jgi:hypothetical protein
VTESRRRRHEDFEPVDEVAIAFHAGREFLGDLPEPIDKPPQLID